MPAADAAADLQQPKSAGDVVEQDDVAHPGRVDLASVGNKGRTDQVAIGRPTSRPCGTSSSNLAGDPHQGRRIIDQPGRLRRHERLRRPCDRRGGCDCLGGSDVGELLGS